MTMLPGQKVESKNFLKKIFGSSSSKKQKSTDVAPDESGGFNVGRLRDSMTHEYDLDAASDSLASAWNLDRDRPSATNRPYKPQYIDTTQYTNERIWGLPPKQASKNSRQRPNPAQQAFGNVMSDVNYHANQFLERDIFPHSDSDE